MLRDHGCYVFSGDLRVSKRREPAGRLLSHVNQKPVARTFPITSRTEGVKNPNNAHRQLVRIHAQFCCDCRKSQSHVWPQLIVHFTNAFISWCPSFYSVSLHTPSPFVTIAVVFASISDAICSSRYSGLIWVMSFMKSETASGWMPACFAIATIKRFA